MCVYLQETVDEWMSDLMRKMTVESLVRKPEEGEVEMIEWQQTSSSRSRDRSQEDPRQHTRGSQSTSTGLDSKLRPGFDILPTCPTKRFKERELL